MPCRYLKLLTWEVAFNTVEQAYATEQLIFDELDELDSVKSLYLYLVQNQIWPSEPRVRSPWGSSTQGLTGPDVRISRPSGKQDDSHVIQPDT